jgi:tetratricopeptide (TPR) repeat protein
MASALAARRIAAQTGSPRLSRINGITLALLHLQDDRLADAYAAADLAVRSSRNTPGAGAYAMRGIVEWRQKRHIRAAEDFERALSMAREASDSELCDVLDISGLAQAGLALARRPGADEGAALATYQSAIRLADVRGAHERRRALFRELVADNPAELPRLRALLQVTTIPRTEP